jgi:hypothetical protein
MESVRRGGATRVAIATVLILVGLATFGLWRVLSGSEDLPFAQGAAPPASAHVTRDKSYSLAVPGGVKAMLAHGVPAGTVNGGQSISLQCTWSMGTSTDDQALTVSPESTSTKAENTVGHFDAPVTGRIHVNCDGWGAMFIPDADDRPADASGWALLVAMITLTIGAGLGLSELRMTWQRAQVSRASRDEDQVERFVDVTRFRGDNGEGGSGDRDDVAP